VRVDVDEPGREDEAGAGDRLRSRCRDVRRAGAFTIGPNTVLVSQTLSLAGGTLRTAKASKTVLVRVGPDGVPQELPVDFEAILRGRKPDIAVRPDDIIFVPGSTAKSVVYATLGLLPSMLSQRAAYEVSREP